MPDVGVVFLAPDCTPQPLLATRIFRQSSEFVERFDRWRQGTLELRERFRLRGNRHHPLVLVFVKSEPRTQSDPALVVGTDAAACNVR